MTAHELLRPGGVFGPYRVAAELGRGGQGALYRANHSTLEQDVALKVLFSPDRASHKRFLQEGQVLARLRHPNIVEVRDAGEVHGVPYLALELIEGETLQALVRRAGAQDPAQVLALLEPIARALHACHRAGVVHRDLKPENVMVEAGTARPVLLDFGLVKRDAVKMELGLDGQSRFSMSDEFKGTPVYMAPEQIDPSFGEVGPRTDVYALGALLYVLLTGQPPFDGRVGLMGVFSRVMEELPPLPDSAGTRPLRALCLRALAKDPALRPADAGAFAAALRRAVEQRPRRYAVLAGGALLLGLLGVGVAYAGVMSAPAQASSPPPPLGADDREALQAAFEDAQAAKDHARVTDLATRLLERAPAAEQAPLLRARGLAGCALKRYPQAQRDLEATLAATPNDREVVLRLARLLLVDVDHGSEAARREAARRGLELCQSLIDGLGPYSLQAYVLLVEHFRSAKKPSRALKLCKEGRSRLSDPSEVSVLEGLQLESTWDLVKEANARRAFRAIEAMARTFSELAPKLSAPQNRARAYAECARAVLVWQKLDGGRGAYVTGGLAEELFRLGDRASALALKGLPADPKVGHVWAMLHHNARSPRTIEILEAQTKRFPDYLSSQSALANAYVQAGRFAEAKLTCQEAIRLAKAKPVTERTKLEVLTYERNLAFFRAREAAADNRHRDSAHHALEALELGRQLNRPTLDGPPRQLLQRAITLLRFADPPAAARMLEKLRAFDAKR